MFRLVSIMVEMILLLVYQILTSARWNEVQNFEIADVSCTVLLMLRPEVGGMSWESSEVTGALPSSFHSFFLDASTRTCNTFVVHP